jgi:hypothetical protein
MQKELSVSIVSSQERQAAKQELLAMLQNPESGEPNAKNIQVTHSNTRQQII